jgi:hypothetical protein
VSRVLDQPVQGGPAAVQLGAGRLDLGQLVANQAGRVDPGVEADRDRLQAETEVAQGQHLVQPDQVGLGVLAVAGRAALARRQQPDVVPVVQGADGQAGGLGHLADPQGCGLVHADPACTLTSRQVQAPEFPVRRLTSALRAVTIAGMPGGDVIGREPELGLVSAFLDRSVEGPPDS